MVVVGLVVLGAVVLFVTEWLPVDVTAIAIMVTLVVLQPWTGISPTEGISGFSSPATITVLAMLILSAGIGRTGLVQILGRRIAAFAGESLDRQLLATVGVAGPVSAFVNNTPVVAVLVPVVTEVANEGHTSPSKLLIPLSYASQLGGMLTLIGTSTNLLASATAASLAGEYPGLRAFGFFEFTALGAVVFLVGSAYLLTVGHRLLPERVPPADDYVESYGIAEYLAAIDVKAGSTLVGNSPSALSERAGGTVDVLRIVRDGVPVADPSAERLDAGDTLLVRTGDEALRTLSAVDAVTAYDWYDPRSTAFDFDADESFDRYLDRVATEFTRWHLAARDHDVAFVPATMPGYDDSAVRPEAETPPLPRSVKRFREQTALATDFLDPEYPLAYITTFNEWHEDTAIEPAPAYGESYLDAHAETKTASPATPALDEYASVTLSFSDTEGEARALATTLRALELADSDKTVAAYDIGVPADEPVITEGAYDIESDGDRTWRWLGGSAARTVVYVPAEQLSSASTLRLFGQPKPSGLSADVTVAGDSLPSLALDQPATGVGRYEVDLSSVTVSVPIATE